MNLHRPWIALALVAIAITGAARHAAAAAPVANDDSYTVRQGGTISLDAPGLLANDNDPDGDALVAEIVTGASFGNSTIFPDGSFVYTSLGGDGGTDTVTYQASDGTDVSNVATITITIIPDNPPVAKDDAFSVAANGVLVIPAPGLFANDTDADGDWLILSTT